MPYTKIFPYKRIGSFLAIGIAALILISSSVNQAVYGQSLNDIFSSSDLTTWIKIKDPAKEQIIEIGQDIGISGEASTGISKDCRVVL